LEKPTTVPFAKNPPSLLLRSFSSCDPNPDARPSAAVDRLLGQAPEKLIVFSVNTIEEGDAPDDTI
jgi:hypothetical protein